MSREVIYKCDVCGCTAPATIGTGDSESMPNNFGGKRWSECNTPYLIGVWHVCSDECFDQFTAEHGPFHRVPGGTRLPQSFGKWYSLTEYENAKYRARQYFESIAEGAADETTK